MVDEETQNVSVGPAGAPVNRDARPDPGLIEGEIAARKTDEKDPPRAARAEASGARARPQQASAHSRARGVLAGAVAGLAVSALAIGAFYTLLAPNADVDENANRLGQIETQAQRGKAALDAEAARESAAIAALDKRVSALESASAASAPNVAAASQAAQHLGHDVQALRADIDAARAEIPGLAGRVAKLESGPPTANGPEVSALAARIDKIEAALASLKSETRVAAEKSPQADNSAAVAIIAGAMADRLASGAPFGPEVAELERLGVDPTGLAALRAAEDGALTGSALAASFEAIAPRVLAAAPQREEGGIVDRLLAHMRSLVRVHDLGGAAGDDPEATVERIEALSRRGDIAGALAAFDRLPEAARQAAGDWPVKARARQAADAALQSIREAAIGRLAGGASP